MNKIQEYKLLPNNDELIIDSNLRYHLFRNCDELTAGKEAIFVNSYQNDWWKYRDISGFEHLYNERNEELTNNIKTMYVECYINNYWKYMLKSGSWIIINDKGENITPNEEYIEDCTVNHDGSIEYRTSASSDFKIQQRK